MAKDLDQYRTLGTSVDPKTYEHFRLVAKSKNTTVSRLLKAMVLTMLEQTSREHSLPNPAAGVVVGTEPKRMVV